MSNTRPPMLPPADVDEEIEAALRGDRSKGKQTKMSMSIEQLQIPATTKALAGVVASLVLLILGYSASKQESTEGKVDQIRDAQIEEIKQRAEQNAQIMNRLSGVESEVQQLKSRTEKLETEIRK